MCSDYCACRTGVVPVPMIERLALKGNGDAKRVRRAPTFRDGFSDAAHCMTRH